MRYLPALLLLSSLSAQANTGGLAGSAEPAKIEIVRSMREVNTVLTAEAPIRLGVFTRLYAHRQDQKMMRSLRAQLSAENPGAALIEQIISARTYSRNGGILSTRSSTYGEIFAAAFSGAPAGEFAHSVDGWQINVWHNSKEIISIDGENALEDMVLTDGRSLILSPVGGAKVMEALAIHAHESGDILELQDLHIYVRPVTKVPYSVAGVQTGGMFKWKQLNVGIDLTFDQMWTFLRYARGLNAPCEAWLENRQLATP